MKTELKVILLAHTPNPEKVIATSAKLCYSSSGIADIEDGLTEENIDKFLNKLIMSYPLLVYWFLYVKRMCL